MGTNSEIATNYEWLYLSAKKSGSALCLAITYFYLINLSFLNGVFWSFYVFDFCKNLNCVKNNTRFSCTNIATAYLNLTLNQSYSQNEETNSYIERFLTKLLPFGITY